MEKYVELVRLVVSRKMGKTSKGWGLPKMGKTSKGRGLPEKWPNKGENKNGVGSSKKRDKMSTGWVFMEKWVKLVISVIG